MLQELREGCAPSVVLQQMGGQGLRLSLCVRALCTGLARCFCPVVPDFFQHFLYKTNFLARLIHMLILFYKRSCHTHVEIQIKS